MLKITEGYIDSTASNQSAITNGWGLVKKNSFVKLNISDDETVIFGECKGSGANNYITSVDFINHEAPVYRCSCPSRQFPCKHALGLMYAYVSGKSFSAGNIPEEIRDKREKAEKKEEKKKEKAPEGIKRVNKSALQKKIKAQKEGLELLGKIVYNIARPGLATINVKTLKILEDQAIQLGNYYIPGAQTALREFIELFKNTENNEAVYTRALEYLTRLHSLYKKGTEYLDKKLSDREMLLDTGSTLEEWLGHAWQLSELRESGFVQKDVELVQLSFNSYTDDARKEFVDNGIWLNLKTGQVMETRNYRPFKAAKYIREEDTCYSVIQLKELMVYPGDMNPRVRWENMGMRELQDSDYLLIKSHAQKSFQDLVKLVKNQIKNPLSSKYPLALLSFEKIGIVDNNFVLEAPDGQRMVLADIPEGFEPPSLSLLRLTTRESLHGQAVLVRFHNSIDDMRLYAQPLSIIRNDSIIRLVY